MYWYQVFVSKLRWQVIPLSGEQLWHYALERFGVPTEQQGEIELPQSLIYREGKIDLIERSSVHGASLMVQNTPQFEEEYVKIGDNYLGFCTFWQKPGGWDSSHHQLHYLWEVVAKELVTDVDIFTQLVKADQRRTQWALRQVTMQSANQLKRTRDNNKTDVAAKLAAQQGEEAQEAFLTGGVAFWVATVIVVKRKNLADLEQACRLIENSFYSPAMVRRERQISWEWWQQTLPFVDEDLLMAGLIKRRHLYLAQEAIGLLPVVNTHSRDSKGFELIAEDGGSPLHLDLANPRKHRNLIVLGTTRSGKSVLISGMLSQVLSAHVPVVAIDYPKQDGSSTFSTYTEFLGDRYATYFNVLRESINLFDRPNLSSFNEQEQKERFASYKSFRLSVLTLMVMGSENKGILYDTVKVFLSDTLDLFFKDPQMLELYEKAEIGGLGSEPWQQMPTLHSFCDFFDRCVADNLFTVESGRYSVPTPAEQAIDYIRLKLNFWRNSQIGRCIASPSTVRQDALCFVMAMAQVGSDEDAAVLTMIAYAVALSRSMQYTTSVFFVDECPILFKFPSLVDLIAAMFSNGAKSGLRIILASQEPESIMKTQSASQILQNTSTLLVGRVEDKGSVLQSYTEKLGLEEGVVRRCIEFNPQAWGVYTQWFLKDGQTMNFARYYPY